jgi:hypothetical protein
MIESSTVSLVTRDSDECGPGRRSSAKPLLFGFPRVAQNFTQAARRSFVDSVIQGEK